MPIPGLIAENLAEECDSWTSWRRLRLDDWTILRFQSAGSPVKVRTQTSRIPRFTVASTQDMEEVYEAQRNTADMIPSAKEDAPGGFNPIHFTVLCLTLLTLRVRFANPPTLLEADCTSFSTLKRAVVTGQRIFYIDSLHKKYGPVVRLSPNEVGVADLDAFKEIHKIGTKYMKSEWYLRLANFPKAGVFTMLDPREHGPRRKLLSRSFSRTYLVENWESTVREKALLAVNKIKADAMKGSADVYNWWMLLASDVSAHLAFGESFGMLETGHQNQFLRVLKKLTMGAGIMVEMPFLRLLRFVPITAVQEMFNANEYIIQGAGRAAEMARSRKGETNIFAKVIEDCEKEGEGHIDDMDVKIEAMNIIIAGTDTTGNSPP
ncbi:hypothetical protein OPT61_g10414 [Boeremia exigua]|uniref:Uncharacterized protein n=1 Tax=Boeremia exigua TaxID=749465 RepID=A0ACC2HPR5_9PLEO|nr:hypothetical protein OPT61_g10414 [Boeremia exigua]